MIEIRHKETGALLHKVPAVHTLARANLDALNLAYADLDGVDLSFANLSGTNLTHANMQNAHLDYAVLYITMAPEATDMMQITNLSHANLTGARLSGAHLQGARMEKADLTEARLYFADLYWANLTGAKLVGARMRHAKIHDARLVDADLAGADLSAAFMHSARLTGANFADVILDGTVFSFCSDLHQAVGLDKVVHKSPSALDRHTLRASVPHLPDCFLAGVGYSKTEIKKLRALYPEVEATGGASKRSEV
ncbi:MAG TPA: pentapeptide repeat-containing protein [Capsulimonadaceae bacterium]|nr:pentapeptide repeat-containing protein [Capsulimonadaceae bacterium]